MKRTSIFLILIILLISCSNQKESQSSTSAENSEKGLTISAAISLTDALNDIKKIYEKQNEIELTFNLGGSGKLAQQIQQGAPVDVFISANEEWMDELEDQQLIKPESRDNMTGNQIVLIANEDATFSYQSFADIKTNDVDQIAIGNPDSVPAGKYAKDVLENINLWDELKDQFVLAKDVRQVLTYVESGNADIGFIYNSDVHQADNIKVLATADTSLHEPIVYPIAVMSETQHEKEATHFVQFMQSDEAQEILSRYGFTR